MKTLSTKLLKQFLKQAGEKLTGEWLLLGGTLLPALGLEVRSTVDIDFVGLGKKEANQLLELISLSDELGLGVETINQASSYFLKKAGYEKKDLLPLHEGTSAVIYRPSVELYWKLKLARASETDFVDCEHYFYYCLENGDNLEIKKLSKLVKQTRVIVEMQPSLKRLEEILQKK